MIDACIGAPVSFRVASRNTGPSDPFVPVVRRRPKPALPCDNAGTRRLSDLILCSEVAVRLAARRSLRLCASSFRSDLHERTSRFIAELRFAARRKCCWSRTPNVMRSRLGSRPRHDCSKRGYVRTFPVEALACLSALSDRSAATQPVATIDEAVRIRPAPQSRPARRL
jgi:hypothetical protein